MRDTGYWVLTLVMVTVAMRPLWIVTDTLTPPRRLVPEPVYVPSRYADVVDVVVDVDVATGVDVAAGVVVGTAVDVVTAVDVAGAEAG
jgi:hypothetical protein